MRVGACEGLLMEIIRQQRENESKPAKKIESFVLRVDSFNQVPDHVKFVSSGLLAPPPLPDFSSFPDESAKLHAITEYYRQIAEAPLATIILNESPEKKQIAEQKEELENQITEISQGILASSELLTEQQLRKFTEQLTEIRDRLTNPNITLNELQNIRQEIAGVLRSFQELKSIYEKLRQEKVQAERLRDQIESTFSAYRNQMESDIRPLPQEEQDEFINRLDELETRLGVAFSLEELQSLQSDMEKLQIDVDQKMAEFALAKRLQAAPTVLAERSKKKSGFLHEIKKHFIGETAKDHVYELTRLATFVGGVVSPILLSHFGIHPEPIIGVAAAMAASISMLRGGLKMGEMASPLVEAQYPKAANIIRKLCAVKSLSHLFQFASRVIDVPRPFLYGLVGGGLLEKSGEMFVSGYSWAQPLFDGKGAHGGEAPAQPPTHDGETPTKPPTHGGEAPQSPPHGGEPPAQPPEIGDPISKSTIELVPQNGQSVTEHELKFITGQWPGHEGVSIPQEHNVGAINMLKNIDKALAEQQGTNFTAPSDGNYRLLERGMAEDALQTYVQAMQKLPDNWTVGQLSDPQYGLSGPEQLLLKTGYGGQYLNQSELDTVIKYLEGVK